MSRYHYKQLASVVVPDPYTAVYLTIRQFQMRGDSALTPGVEGDRVELPKRRVRSRGDRPRLFVHVHANVPNEIVRIILVGQDPREAAGVGRKAHVAISVTIEAVSLPEYVVFCHCMGVPDMNDEVRSMGIAGVAHFAESDPLAVGGPGAACDGTVLHCMLRNLNWFRRSVGYVPYLQLGGPRRYYATICRGDCDLERSIMSDPLMGNGRQLEIP